MFMDNWRDDEFACRGRYGWSNLGSRDYESAQKVAARLGFELLKREYIKEYWQMVFEPLIASYARGISLNSDILCNQKVKMRFLRETADELGIEHIATGHYAQTVDGQLCRAHDSTKDQSFFLAGVEKRHLRSVIFPCGTMRKKQVKEIVAALGLGIERQPETMGLCMVGDSHSKVSFKSLLQEHIQQTPGDIIDVQTGSRIGMHSGIELYTLGERIRIGGLDERRYVCKKGADGTLFVCKLDNPALRSESAVLINCNWLSDIVDGTYSVMYRSTDRRCIKAKIAPNGLRALVSFLEPQLAVAPGQFMAIYQGDICLGGGFIDRPHE